jgi:uncharacterized membrane protein
MFWGMTISPSKDVWQSNARRSSMVARVTGARHHAPRSRLMGLHPADVLALIYFVAAWIGYSILVEFTTHGHQSLNAMMNAYRERWMQELLARDMRMVDAQVTAALQNGTAFFASTSLLAIGGVLAMFRSSEQVFSVVSWLPFGETPTQGQWEVKLLGLTVIFVYAFFKFAWSYRLYNYVAIMVGAAPPAKSKATRAAREFAHRTARICADAGRHFNRGQRAFFFALGYLGWFLGPLPFAISTTAIVIVMWRRQFRSQSRLAFSEEAP